MVTAYTKATATENKTLGLWLHGYHSTLSMLHATIVSLSHLVEKEPSQVLFSAQKFNMSLVG